jgi:hypothetical protein
MEGMVQDAALLPVIATVGTEMTLHRPDLFLLPAQVRNLPTAQPAASGSLANAGSLSNLAPIHAALEASRGGPVLHGHVPLLLRTVADATIPRVGRSPGAAHQRAPAAPSISAAIAAPAIWKFFMAASPG